MIEAKNFVFLTNVSWSEKECVGMLKFYGNGRVLQVAENQLKGMVCEMMNKGSRSNQSLLLEQSAIVCRTMNINRSHNHS